MKKKTIITYTTLALGGLAITSMVAGTAVSCSSNSSESLGQQIVKLNNQYVAKKMSLQNTLGLPKAGADGKVDTTGKALVDNAQAAVKALEEFKTNNKNLDTNEQIWLDNYIYSWTNEIANWNTGLQYLGGNPSGDALPLNPNSNHLENNINSAINIYDIDPESGEPIADDKHIDEDLAKAYPQVGQDIIDYINSLQAMLSKGMESGVMQCNITKKLFVNQMLSDFYKNELVYWVKQSTEQNKGIEIALPVPVNGFEASNSLLKNFVTWEGWAKQNLDSNTISETKTSLQKAQQALDEFMNWYIKSYYTSNKSFGGSNASLTITATNTDNEVNRTVKIKDDNQTYTIYGLGITNKELNTKNVGIGFMTSTLEINNKSIRGNDIYQQLLNNNNSVSKTAAELVATGSGFVETSINNMKSIGEKIAKINAPTGSWTPEVKYDDDISDTTAPQNVTMKIWDGTTLNFAEFNKWLNQEDFFFGRETSFWGQPYNGSGSTTNLDAYTNPNTNSEFKNYLDALTKLGYAGPKGIWGGSDSNSPINGEGSVNGKQALAGAVLSLVSYNKFKNLTADTYNWSFNEIPEYNVAAYNQEVQKIIGVGMEGPRGSNLFNYNVNPYYSVPKWTQSSFQTHEGKMGHHTQQAYWTKYMPKDGPGYVFKQDAFHEGWAVFSEWYANQLEVYGSGVDEKTGMPSDWLHAKGMVPKISNITSPTDADIKAIKNFQAGVYWEAVKGAPHSQSAPGSSQNLTQEQMQAINATEVANMLQYYGFLNEAQLRNMRLVVDPLYHNNSTVGTGVTDGQGNTISYGASINDVRNYLQANSGLSQGDIESESFRYLNMPSQATGYMTGKVIFQELYQQVESQYNKNNPGKKFNQDKTAVRALFDLMLRNGEISFDVLQNAVKTVYKLS